MVSIPPSHKERGDFFPKNIFHGGRGGRHKFCGGKFFEAGIVLHGRTDDQIISKGDKSFTKCIFQ